MTPDNTQEIRDLARAFRRLNANRRDPEAYHVQKDAIAEALMAIARKLEAAA